MILNCNTKPEIKYVVGDATYPKSDGNIILCHICNDIGAWGAGFVLAVSKRWKHPEIAYRANAKLEYELGDVGFIRVENNIIVANMIAQHGVGYDSANNNPPISYPALRICLAKANDLAFNTQAELHMPRIGCGLAGGDWKEIEKIIREVMSVNVVVYDLK